MRLGPCAALAHMSCATREASVLPLWPPAPPGHRSPHPSAGVPQRTPGADRRHRHFAMAMHSSLHLNQ
ncbi:hypothetical protein XabCFBP2524_00795 [Xanthomonas axonopodis pv. begoniae]|nr:hypothetical protein XabCFBP2524_00795 [Xanthomonas axonopodis pv. begoniae]